MTNFVLFFDKYFVFNELFSGIIVPSACLARILGQRGAIPEKSLKRKDLYARTGKNSRG
jgi:hypothetical protein